MQPSVIAIIGRPNVGKSTLFNRLTRTRAAIVDNQPGVTRDRHHGLADIDGNTLILIDTAGWSSVDDPLQTQLNAQAQAAIQEADLILLMTDSVAGIMPEDQDLVSLLRPQAIPIILVANKMDGKGGQYGSSEFYALGIGDPLSISAKSGRGLPALRTQILNLLKLTPIEAGTTEEEPTNPKERSELKLALLGRPNVGKSTLLNQFAGEERMLVSKRAGTTRDAIAHDVQRAGKRFTVVDTAGLRRQSKVSDSIERFAVLRSLQALSEADVCVVLFNTAEQISEQDLRLLGLAVQTGIPIVIGLNQWDRLDKDDRKAVKHRLELQLSFIDYVETIDCSALTGRGVNRLLQAVYRAYRASQTLLNTSALTRALEQAVERHPPPVSGTRRIKLRFAHIAGRRPITIKIHGKQATALPGHYQKYLAKYFRKCFKLVGVPVQIHLKNDHNPYQPKSK